MIPTISTTSETHPAPPCWASSSCFHGDSTIHPSGPPPPVRAPLNLRANANCLDWLSSLPGHQEEDWQEMPPLLVRCVFLKSADPTSSCWWSRVSPSSSSPAAETQQSWNATISQFQLSLFGINATNCFSNYPRAADWLETAASFNVFQLQLSCEQNSSWGYKLSDNSIWQSSCRRSC